MRARGFSLVEFMIAITIGLFMVAGLVYLIAETSRSRAEIERSSRQIENGRYALDRIAEDLRHAGFFGEPANDFPTVTGTPAVTAMPNPCATAIAAGDFGLGIPVQAYDGAASLPAAVSGCLTGLDWKPQTDILVVRRASSATMTKAAAALGTNGTTLFLQTGRGTSDSFTHRIDRGSNTGNFSLTRVTGTDGAFTSVDAMLRRYFVHIYFISTTDSTGAASPTLKMLELGPGPAFQVLSIADGIEELRFDFGIDTDGTVAGGTADGVAECVVRFTKCSGAALATAADELEHWSNLVSVQVHLVARNTERSPGYSDDKTYDMGIKGYTTATNDGYRRHAYATYVRLNNVAMPRE